MTQDTPRARWVRFNTVQAMLDNISRTTLYRMIERGDLPEPFKVGRFNYWHHDEITAAIAELQGG